MTKAGYRGPLRGTGSMEGGLELKQRRGTILGQGAQTQQKWSKTAREHSHEGGPAIMMGIGVGIKGLSRCISVTAKIKNQNKHSGLGL